MCLSFVSILLIGILSSNREWWSQAEWKQAPDFEESEVRRPSRPWTHPSTRRHPITTNTDHRHHVHFLWGLTCPHQAHWCVSSCVCVMIVLLRFDPYGKAGFAICRICKSSVHQSGSHYCQGCAYKKGTGAATPAASWPGKPPWAPRLTRNLQDSGDVWTF